MGRDYSQVLRAAGDHLRPEMDRRERMQLVADLLWEAFGTGGARVSWVGFYLPDETGERLVLGPRRDKPACSPIGLHGVCGNAFATCRAVIVGDVRELGDAYIACDPGDRSELAVPMLDEAGHCLGVIDLDSRAVGAFDEGDAAGVTQVLVWQRLTARPQGGRSAEDP